MSWYSWHDKALILRVRVQPRAIRDAVAGPHGDHLKIRLAAAPVDGKANARLISMLARLCGVAKGDVAIVSGAGCQNKRVRIEHPRVLPQGVEPDLP
ncbi:MAG: DUF167 family protein [Gammaproteobacteria bacterium]